MFIFSCLSFGLKERTLHLTYALFADFAELFPHDIVFPKGGKSFFRSLEIEKCVMSFEDLWQGKGCFLGEASLFLHIFGHMHFIVVEKAF